MKNIAQRYITAYNLRIAAFIMMIINHAGKYLFSYGSAAYKFQVFITRGAFVIFCFFVAEGMVHTRNRIKYLGRILLTALISEAIYDLYFYGDVPYWGAQNVCFTLFIGGLVIYLNDLCKEKISNRTIRVLSQLLITAIFTHISSFSFVSYGFVGVVLILEFYYLREHKLAMIMCVALSLSPLWGLQVCRHYVYRDNPNISFALFLANAKIELPGILVLPFLYCYSGNQGKKMPRFLVYGFYPIHLCVLYILMKVFI